MAAQRFAAYAGEVSRQLQTLLDATDVELQPAVTLVAYGARRCEHYVPAESAERHQWKCHGEKRPPPVVNAGFYYGHSAIQSLLEESHADSTCHPVGVKGTEDIGELMSLLDLSLLPSEWLEQLLTNCPTDSGASTAHGDLSDLLGSETDCSESASLRLQDASPPPSTENDSYMSMIGPRSQISSLDAARERRRTKKAHAARRLRIRKKVELAELKAEQSALIQRLQLLKGKSNRRGSSAQSKSPVTRTCKQVDEENKKLRRELCLLNEFTRGLEAALALPKSSSGDVNMCYFLHTPMHLPRDARSRGGALQAVCTDAKLEQASRILHNETRRTRPCTTPNFSWMPLNLGPSSFGMTSIAVFALETGNVHKAFNAARNAIMTSGVIWPSYSLMDSSEQQFDMSSADFQIQYAVAENRFQSSSSNEQVLIESRSISYCRVNDQGGTFIWDYADEDELYPLKKTPTVKRSAVGALLVRLEHCDDGVERVVCRYICSKVHTIHSSELPPDIQRFSQSSKAGAQIADSLVFESTKGSVS